MATTAISPDLASPASIHSPQPKKSPTLDLPTLAPTTTPIPSMEPVVLVVPAAWERAADRAIELARGNVSGVNWRFRRADELPAADESQTMQMVLLPDGEGRFVDDLPLLFSVPFSSPWDGFSLDQAQSILAEGHETILVEHAIERSVTRRALPVAGLLPSDPSYPVTVSWSLHAEPAVEEHAALLAAFLKLALQDTGPIRLAAVGDIMLDRVLGSAIMQGDIAYPLQETAPILAAADLSIGNLESALGESGVRQPKRYAFQAPRGAIETLSLAGLDLLSLANNHALDFGPESLLEGIEMLQAAGIRTVGAGKDASAAHEAAIIQVGGLRLAFLAYVNVPVEASGFDTRSWEALEGTPGLAWGDPERMAADVARARLQSDVVIVLLHSGFESWMRPNAIQQACARAAIEAGAQLVLGHHAHALQGVEFYGQGVIAYGLGNFAFQMDADPRSVILIAEIDSTGVRQLEVMPVLLDKLGRPSLASGTQARQIRRHIYQLSAQLEQEVQE